MSRLRKYVSLFLVLVLSFVLLPRELVHGLYGHTDTPHDYCKDHEGVHVEPRHVHCAIFDFNLPAFFYSFGTFSFYLTAAAPALTDQAAQAVTSSLFNLALLRAPPVSF